MHVKHEFFIYTKFLRYVSRHIFAIKTLKSKVRFLIGFNVKTILSLKDSKEWKANSISLHRMVHLRRPQYKTKNTSRKRKDEQEKKNHRTMDLAEKEVMHLREKNQQNTVQMELKIYSLEIYIL